MELSPDTTDFFSLITELCDSLLGKSSLDKHEHKNKRIVNKMRKKAFEILLNKGCENYEIYDNQENDTFDPTTDLLKYAFVLRSTFGLDSRALKLENALDCLLEKPEESKIILRSVIEFLYALKSYQIADKNDLNIFHFGEENPALPDRSFGANNVTGYQIYPSSAFILPYRIDSSTHTNLINVSDVKLDAPFSFSRHLQRELANEDAEKHSDFISTNSLLMGSTNFYLFSNNATETIWKEKLECQSVTSEETVKKPSLELFHCDDLKSAVTENRTWENLGSPEDPKITQFIFESDIAIQHLQNFRRWPAIADNIQLKVDNIISLNEFMENVKLVLLGIESDYFWWNSKIGFVFKNNTTIPGISSEALNDVCLEITEWATCFKLLSILVQTNQDSVGKVRQDGLILTAMCNNVGDILLHYQAVILQVFSDTPELVDLLNRLRPLGDLIYEVGRLCKCDKTMQTTLGEGTGILSHIYKQVTKITKPTVSLMYYSVLKSCCEIYFQMLEKWIFEGACDESHGEFMIKVRSQYLRHKGHKFWSKCFGIHRESVPGFLENLTDSILQCGKAVRLLKICDPKNSLCHLFSTSRPSVKVCLNVNMLLQQEEICQDYMNRGIETLGANVTLRSALEQLKIAEKERAEHVAAAQQGFFDRIKKSREQQKLLLAKNKQELLADLKSQAEEAISRKEKAKAAKLLEEKLMMEKAVAEDEEAKSLKLAEAKQTFDYYKELAEEANKSRLRALWRAKRMSLFDERLDAIIAARKDELSIEINDNSPMYEALEVENNPPIIIDENSNRSTDESEQKSETDGKTRTPRPTDLPVKSKETSSTIEIQNLPVETKISEILDEISETENLLDNNQIENTNLSSTREMVMIDREENENNNGLENIDSETDPNKNKCLPLENKEKSIDIETDNQNNDFLKSVDVMQISQTVINDLNDFTPMSCATDSYVPSGASSTAFYNFEAGSFTCSKNDLETPITPGDGIHKSTMNMPTSNSFFSGLGFDRGTTITFDSSLTMADVELIDNASLRIYLEKSVVIPLLVQSRLANSAVIKCLLQEHKILSHFQSLRSFFFLLNGEFAKNLSGALYKKFYEISTPVELFNSATLRNLLENALHSSLNCSYKNSELLSLSANEVPARLQVSDPEALDCLCLNYKVSWPLNIILDESLMQQYRKVFKFLTMVGRVLWVLQEDFCLLKVERKAAMSPQYHKLQLYRHAMMQFMTAFNNYLTCSVLHASWSEFEKDLESTTTLDHIYSTHVSYIKKILSRCMLTSRAEKLRQCLVSIFKIILQFHNCLRSQEWHPTANGYTHSNYAKLEKMYKAFCELRTYPAIVVEKLANNGYQSHLTHFLDALNINPLYNLSTKGL